MAAKVIQISDDNGVTWSTLPGNSGEMTSEGTSIDDTVFGQLFKSSQSGMISWGVNGNGLYKGFAGYNANLFISGISSVITDEAMSLVSGKTYQVTNAARRVIDPDVAVVVEDNGVAVAAANILNIDYVWGRVTFVGSYTPAGAITITGAYLPVAALARANSFTLSQTRDAIDDTDFESAQASDGHRQFLANGLKTVSLDLGGIWNSTDDWRTKLIGRDQVLIEINPDGNGKSVARGFFRPITMSQSGDVGAQEEKTSTWELSVPDIQLLKAPFSWLHAADTTLNAAIRKALASYEGDTLVDIRYLADGVNGWRGDAIVTDLSLAGGLDVMNEFTVNVQGSGALTAVP